MRRLMVSARQRQSGGCCPILQEAMKKSRKMDEQNLFERRKRPELFWSKIPVGQSIFKFYFQDILNYRKSTFNREGVDYVVFLVTAAEDYQDLGIVKDVAFDLHIPTKAFRQAYSELFVDPMNGVNLKSSEKVEAIVHLQRPTKKRIVFTKFQIIRLKP